MSQISAITTAMHALWDSREAREQRLIACAAAVVACAAVYALLIDPAQTGMARLKTILPQLQAQAAQVQQLATQLQAKNGVDGGSNNGLNGGSASTNAPAGNNQAALQKSLAQAGVQAKVSAAAPWTVSVEAASGDALWTWLKNHSAARSQLKRNANGSWQGEITLEP